MRAFLCLFCSVFICAFIREAASTKFRYKVYIGGLFGIEPSHFTFRRTVKREPNEKFDFKTASLLVNVTDSFYTSRTTCSLSSNNRGVIAVVRDFGGRDALSAICNRTKVPELVTSYLPTMSRKLAETSYKNSFYYYPKASDISKAIVRIVAYYEWTSFVILYEDFDSMSRLNEVIKSQASAKNPSIYFYRIVKGGNNKPTFKHISLNNLNKIILDCHKDNVIGYLNETVQVNNKTDYQSYILTSLDAHTLNISVVEKMMANISTIHMIDRNDISLYKNLVKSIRREMETPYDQIDENSISLETVLVDDATQHLLSAVNQIPNLNAFENGYGANIDPTLLQIPALCSNTTDVWNLSDNLTFYLENHNIEATTGRVQLDSEHNRINYVLFHSELRKDFLQVGYWNSSDDVYNRTITQTEDVGRQSVLGFNKVIRVGSMFGDPYLYPKNNSTDMQGNDQYEGYVVDLIAEIVEYIKNETGQKFTYEFYVNPKEQSGLIQDVLKNDADLAICDMTITYDRTALVDFSQPFMDLGISILFAKPEKTPPDMYGFLLPLALDLWLGLLTTYLIVSFTLFVCARMSQEDWVNPHPCDRKPQTLENIWNLYNSTWITMGSIMTQGSDILPRAGGSRTVTAAWWFFALIITSGYTSNMSVFITNSRKNKDIQGVEDLVKQNKIKFGVMYGKSTYNFFKNSKEDIFQKVFTMMENTKPTVYVNSNKEGKERVVKGNHKYAFFMESTGIEFYTQRFCDLRMVGRFLDSKQYGIAMPKDSPYRVYINNAIVKFQENGKLLELKKKWWEDYENEAKCKEQEEAEEKNKDEEDSLQMEDTSGIFVLLGYGALMAVGVALYDYSCQARKVAIREKMALSSAFKIELKASLDFRTLSKPVDPVRAASEAPRDLPKSRTTSFLNLDRVY